MGKFSNVVQLTEDERERLFIRFARLLGSVKTPTEGAQILRDLLTEPEVLTVARRLQIVEMLEAHMSYAQIIREAKVSSGTITKVQTWLRLHGTDFRKILSRTASRPAEDGILSTSYRAMKRKYPMYHWPELLLEEIVTTANNRQRNRILTALHQLKEKTEVTERLHKLLRPSRTKHR